MKRMQPLLPTLALALAAALPAPAARAVPLVSDATVAEQVKLTASFTLANGIPVVYRRIDGSDILHLEISFAHGLVDGSPAEKSATGLMYETMAQGAKGWPKDKIFATSETYSSPVACQEGLEYSTCEMTTLDDYWAKMLPMFTAIVKEPTFADADVKLAKARKTAEVKRELQNPEKYVNEAVNEVFYRKGHPFWMSAEDNLARIPGVTRAQLQAQHKEALNAKRMRIVVVGSLPEAQLKADLEKAFGGIKGRDFTRPAATPPAFDPQNAVKMVDRKIPTAYIRLKLNTPGFRAEDQAAVQLLYKILDEELGDEIRTRRSLSYAVYSFTLDYDIGIGVISASTSKPKETLAAMDEVIRRLKDKVYTDKELEAHKVVYATQYFLTLEEHSSLAGTLARYLSYDGNVGRFYQLPRDLGAVTPQKIHELANKLLTDFRAAVVFDQSQVKEEWVSNLIKHHASKPSPAH